jgi:hypothetical protein
MPNFAEAAVQVSRVEKLAHTISLVIGSCFFSVYGERPFMGISIQLTRSSPAWVTETGVSEVALMGFQGRGM